MNYICFHYSYQSQIDYNYIFYIEVDNLFFILEDDQRGKELSQILLNNGYYVSNDFKDLKYADYIYFGLKGIDIKNRIICNGETYYIDCKLLKKGCVVITIVYNSYLNDLCHDNGYHYYSMLKDKDYLRLNTIMTSEGLISFMIDKIDKPLYNSNILILGYGNCGKSITKILKAFGSIVTVAVRKAELKEEIESYGYEFILLDSININDYDYIINTIPSVIINKDILNKPYKDIIFFDIASYPFGIDHHEAIRLGYDSYIISSIPSSYYPKFSSKLIYEFILKKMIHDA